ncbi:hypothetical protein H4R34_005234, partial [Dimargaris verticillata]
MVAFNTATRNMTCYLGVVLLLHASLFSLVHAGISDQQRGARPNQYIVQFNTNAANAGVRTRGIMDKISGFLDDAKALLSTAKVQFHILKNINTKLFNGSLVTIAQENVAKLRQMPGVKNVWSNRVYSISQEQMPPANTTAQKPLEPMPMQPFNVLNMTGVGALHEKGLT